MKGAEQIDHADWEDVTETTGFDYHWHHLRYEPYMSIRMQDESVGLYDGLGAYREGWTIELYPDPDNDGRCSRWRRETADEAREKVQELMKEYADAE